MTTVGSSSGPGVPGWDGRRPGAAVAAAGVAGVVPAGRTSRSAFVMWRRVTSSECPKTAAPTADTTEASAAPVRVPATPSREPITAAVTAAAVLATIWVTDNPNLLSPSWSPAAVAAADPTAAPVVAGGIFWVAGSGVTRRGPGTGVRSDAIISEVSRVRCRLPVDDPSVGRCRPTAHQRQPTTGTSRPGVRFGSGAGPHTAPPTRPGAQRARSTRVPRPGPAAGVTPRFADGVRQMLSPRCPT